MKLLCFFYLLAFALCAQANTPHLKFSADELHWLAENHEVRVRVSNFAPFHFVDNNTVQGISVDIMNKIVEMTGLRIRYIHDSNWKDALKAISQHEKYDILLTAKQTPERALQMGFTQDYLHLPWVIFTRTSAELINSEYDLDGKRVTVEAGYVMQKLLQKHVPGAELIVVNGGTPDALKSVSTGKADAYVGNLTVANYFIGRLGLNNLKVAAPTQFGDHTQAMAVRSDWPKLISILNKSLAQLSPQQRSEISRRWLSVKYEQGYSKQEMFGTAIIISAPLAFLLWLFYHWNQHLKTEIMLRNQLTTRLQDSEARFRELFQSMSSGVAIYEAVENGRNFIFKDMNQAGERISNVSRDKICGRLVTECFPGVDKPEFGLFQIFQQVYQDGQYRFHPLTFYTDEHHKLWVENKVFKLPSGEIVAVYDDVSARKHAEAEVRLYASVYENSGEAILITDANNKIIAINEAFTRLTGYHFHEVEGKDPKILASGKTTPATYQQLWQALQEKGYWQGQLWDQQRDGKIYPKWAAISVVHNEQGEISNYVASFTDISERIAAEQRIHQLAHNDTLTGLLNRFSLEEALQQILDQARQNNHSIALMFIDLDNFKNINDTLGHHLGDELLKAVAKRISNSVRHSDIVARLGGDEFIVVLSHLNDSQVTVNIANKIVSAVSALYQINGQELHTSPSIGISLYPTDGEYVEDLMQCADTAMYQAKSKGKCGYKFFAEEMTFVAQERMLLERELRHALSKNQLELYYQPQVSVTQQKLIGVEALIRWHHPLQGQIFPARFIPIAEESGLIQPLGRWILECACQQVAAWRQMGLPDFYVAVNISAHQLLSGDLFDLVKNTLAQYHIPPSQLELEITETVAMQNPEQAIQILEKLDKLGVSLTIDDFGTGYSSLAYLKRLPIHSLKLDQTFVRDIETDANDAAISSATIALAHKLGLKVVAEGVETTAQRDFLIQNECDILQGYLYSRPLPNKQLLDFIRQFNY